jgi:DHA2 family lincomycin resistance protein-like MFS transporter
VVAACVWLATMPNKAQDTASTEKESTHNVTDQKLPRESKTIIAVLLVASFVTFLNETILGVALPDIMKQLRIEPSTGQWLTTAFMLTMAVVIPTTGWIMQRLSTRMVYILALTLFSLGTLMAAVSGNFELLLLGRVLQACGTAIMMPLTMTTIMQVVPEHSRGKIMGTVSIVMSLAPALGPTISGLVLSFADWRAIFWLVLPIAVGALVIGGSKIHNHTDSQRISLDFMSVALAALAFGGTIYGLSDFGDAARGTAPIAPGIPLTAGLVMMALFIWRQIVLQKTDSALLDLRVFLAPHFAQIQTIFVLAMVSMFGVVILLPIYMQNVLGVTPLVTGLFLLPGGLLMGFLGPITGRYYDSHGPRFLIIPGAIITSTSLWIMATFGQNTPLWLVPAAHIIMSVGLALLFTPMFTLSLSAVPAKLYGHASAILGTMQQIAGAAGTALFVTLLTQVSVAQISQGSSDTAAAAAGMHIAFLAGAIMSLIAVVLVFWVKAPQNVEGAAPTAPAMH